jgi:hypothetical protein
MLSVSSDVATAVASGTTVVSLAEVVIPSLPQLLFVVAHEPSDLAKLVPTEAAAASQANGTEPELGNAIVPLDVNVRGLATIAGVEKAPIGANSQHRRHRAARFGGSVREV